MKNVIKLTGIGLMALAIAGAELKLHAQAQDAPGAAQPAAKSERAIPFHGKVKAFDKEAGTLTVGSRTFQITPDTRYLQGSADSIQVGEKVGGSYYKQDDGTLTVNSIRIGPKASDESAE